MIYQEYTARTDQVFCRVFYSTNLPGERPMKPHCHSLIEIALVMSGSGTYQTQSSVCPFRAGELFFFAADEIHYVVKIDDYEPLLLLNVQFSMDKAFDTKDFSDCDAFLHIRENDIGNGTNPAHNLKCIQQECIDRMIGWEKMLEVELTALLCQWRRYRICHQSFSCQKQEWRGPNKQYITRAKKYIAEHLTEEIELGAVANEAGLSRNYFSAVFHTYTGMRVWDYITRERIELAIQWLVDTDYSVTEIATRCGFNHSTNFAKVFRKYTGQSPSAFRKNSYYLGR